MTLLSASDNGVTSDLVAATVSACNYFIRSISLSVIAETFFLGFFFLTLSFFGFFFVESPAWVGVAVSADTAPTVVVGPWLVEDAFSGTAGPSEDSSVYSRAYALVFLPILLKKNYLNYLLFSEKY